MDKIEDILSPITLYMMLLSLSFIMFLLLLILILSTFKMHNPRKGNRRESRQTMTKAYIIV